MENSKPRTPQEQLRRIEQAIERWRRKPPSRRQRLILAGYRRAASELRDQIAVNDPLTANDGLILGASDRLPVLGTYTLAAPYRVFRVIRNPAAGSLTGARRLTRTTLRVVKG